MANQFERQRDLVGGALVAAIGLGFLALGRGLEFGDTFRMGPGYFPAVLSGLLVALGAALMLQAWRSGHEEGAFSHIPWRGLLLVVGAVAFFGFTIRGLGLAPAVALVVLATAQASRYARWLPSLLLALGMAAACSLLFIQALGLPLPIFGPWLSPDAWWPAANAPAP